MRPKSNDFTSFQSKKEAFLSQIGSALERDPGLPRANPTVSSWQVPEYPLASHRSPQFPEYTDYAIIGSGITGCSATKALLEHPAAAGAHVTVLEARTLVSGATGRNGGHLVTASGHTYGPLRDKHGSEAAKEITRFSIMNIDHLLNLALSMDPALREECQIRRLLKVMAVGDEETWRSVKRSVLDFQEAVPEYSTYHRIIEKEHVVERWNIKDSFGAVEHQAGAVWPYRLLMRIYEQLLETHHERLAIETNTPVTSVEFSPDIESEYRYTIQTSRGVLRAKYVVHCTNAYASHLLPRLRGKLYPFRGTMTVQEPGPLLPRVGDSRSWSLSHASTMDLRTGLYTTGLYYLQQNALTGQIWIGNETAYLENIITSDDTYVPDEAKHALETVLPRLFFNGWKTNEEKSEIAAAWSGIQGHTADGLPVVGRVPEIMREQPGDDGQWIAAGFNGYGMDKCWLTGVALVEMMVSGQVPSWFPRSFLITNERLDKGLTLERSMSNFENIPQVGNRESRL
ncbi:fad dependent oxidoreductase superfamily protein [Fusarium avenaceum]|nr:fad dependent oxidoreductase superfamily protein [Fusarium avenaceum]